MRRLGPRSVGFLVLGALMAVGLALRVRHIGDLDLWYDEVALWLYSLTGAPPTPLEPPLMSWILLGAMRMLNSARPFVIHIVPIVIGVLTIPVAYLCGAAVDRDRSTGWIAAILLAISPMAIYYSREGRPYALFILLSTALYVAFLNAYQAGTTRSWALFGVLLFLCGLTHLLTFQILLVLALFVAISTVLKGSAFRVSRANLVVLGIAAVAGGSWGAYRFLSSTGSAIAMWRAFDGVYPFGPMSFFRTVIVNLGPGPVRAIFGGFSSSDFLALIFLVLFGMGLRRLYVTGRQHLALFAGLVFAIPLFVSYLTLGEKGSWDWARYISHLLVPFLVVCSLGWQSATSVLKRGFLRAAALLLFVAAILPQTLSLPVREEYLTYRAMVTYLDEHRTELKGVIVLSYLQYIGQADERIANIYFQLKREKLPVYQLSDGAIRQVALVPSRGDITRVARDGPIQAQALPSGRYALLWRQPLTDCRLVSNWVKNGKVTAADSVPEVPVPAGITTCELDFFN